MAKYLAEVLSLAAGWPHAYQAPIPKLEDPCANVTDKFTVGSFLGGSWTHKPIRVLPEYLECPLHGAAADGKRSTWVTNVRTLTQHRSSAELL